MGSRRMWIRLRRVMTQTSPHQERKRSKGPGAATSSGQGGRGAHARTPSTMAFALGGRVGPGERGEHVVERRLMDGDVVDQDAGLVERAQHGRGQARLAAHDRAQPAAVVGDLDRAQGEGGDRRRRAGVGLGEGHLEQLRAGGRLELARRALGDHAAVIDHGDAVGQGVGLVQVLGREPERDALGDQAADHAPHALPAGRVEAGGGLVEEEHGRPHDQAGGQVEAAAHAARVALDHAVGGVVELEQAEQLGCPAARLRAPQAAELAHHDQVLAAGERLVEGGVLAGHADLAAHGGGLA